MQEKGEKIVLLIFCLYNEIKKEKVAKKNSQIFKRLLITTKTCRFWKRNAILQHIFAIY